MPLLRSLSLILPIVIALQSFACADSIVRFVLVRADSNVDLFDLVDGQDIDIATLPTTQLNVRAETEDANTGSVRFDLNGTVGYQTESVEPYALEGDTGGNYNAWFPGLGSHTLTATPFSGASGAGTAGSSLTVGFSFTSSTPGNTPPSADFVSAGAAQFLPLATTSATLLGTIETTGTVEWTQVYGPSASILTPKALSTAVTGLQGNAVHVFRLTLTTAEGSFADEVVVAPLSASPQAPVITGELKQWHRVTLTYDGPTATETGTTNPALDYKLDVYFTQGDITLRVPGFFAADGDAAESGAESGSSWRVHFRPIATGEWSSVALFRTGTAVAINLDPNAGTLVSSVNGSSATLQIGATDKVAPDFRGRGLLEYTGERYLRFAGDNTLFLKGGADSPENFLAYEEFDGTFDNNGSFLHAYQPHLGDWSVGDPLWQGSKGQGIIGALNYLASEEMNSVYFVTMNVNGDGQDVWPWTAPGARTRYDVSKLDQWEIVFNHMDQLGLQLHVVTQETENDQLLDGGDLGTERRLYYRELVARFGHHLAVVWNLGEENTNTDAQRQAFADNIRDLDPYQHPIVVHTFPGALSSVYTPLLGYGNFEGPSIQTNANLTPIHNITLDWISQSTSAGRPWFVCIDEPGSAQEGAVPDSVDPTHDDIRKNALWANLMAGGSGCEWYFGYGHPNDDLDCEDWRSRDLLWDLTRHALNFFAPHPLAEMSAADNLLSGNGWCLAKPGELYIAYLPDGGNADLAVDPGSYQVTWYNPRTGETLPSTSVTVTTGDLPLSAATNDWAVTIERSVTRQLLVFYETAGFTHGGQINAGRTMFAELAPLADVTVTEAATSDGFFTEASLANYDVVVFLNTTGNVLNATEQGAFENYIANGGSYLGIHSATDTEYSWPFYGNLVGAYFQNHPPGTTPATLNVVDNTHPSTATLATPFTWTDEWYNFQTNPADDPETQVLITIDETTYSGGTMGDPHPISWAREVLGGRSWYTAMGHNTSTYSEVFFRDHVLGGLEWLLEVPSQVGFRRGAINEDSAIDLSDVVNLLGYLFGDLTIDCLSAADINDDGALGLTDALSQLNYLFTGTFVIPEPFAVCGEDPTADALTCDAICP